MILISHRGNQNGPNPNLENTPPYIQKALEEGFDVEIDAWFTDSKIYLGHDKPTTPVELKYLKHHKFWVHAKNIQILPILIDNKINCFFHQTDEAVLTHSRHIWTYPGKELFDRSICVLPERSSYSVDQIKSCTGVCSDFISGYKDF